MVGNGPFVNLIDACNHTGVDFIFTELETARTFLQTAETTQLEESRVRNRNNAQIAGESAERYAQKVTLTLEEKERFDVLLADVKRKLVEAEITI